MTTVETSLALWVVGAVALQLVVSKSRSPATPTATATAHHSQQQQKQQLARFPRRSALHLQRKAQHALTGLLFFFAAGALPMDHAVCALLLAAGAFAVLHFLRGVAPRVNAFYLASFSTILRREEAARRVLPGAFYFLLGAALTAALFPLSVVRLAILHLAVGDPAAALCGTLYGRRSAKREQTHDDKHINTQRMWALGGNKSWAGFIGAFFVTMLASAAAMRFVDLGGDGVFYPQPLSAALGAKALYAGLAAATAEAVDLGWDDNLTLPLLSSLLLQLGTAVFGFQF